MTESSNARHAKPRTGGTGHLPVWFGALLSQAVGVFGGFAAYIGWVQYDGVGASIGPAVLIAGAVAALVGHAVFRLPGWWLPINFVFAPGLYIGVAGEWPGWIFGGLFVATLLVFWNVVRDRVPLYLSNRITCDAVATLLRDLRPAPDDETDNPPHVPPPLGRFCDLGSGTGGFAIRIGAACPRWQVVGYESSPVLWFLSILRASCRRRNSTAFVRRNFWDQSLASFDAVYAFLSPEPMARLLEKVNREMKPGSLFISNSFDVPGAEPDEIRHLDDRRKTRLLVWRL